MNLVVGGHSSAHNPNLESQLTFKFALGSFVSSSLCSKWVQVVEIDSMDGGSQKSTRFS